MIYNALKAWVLCSIICPFANYEPQERTELPTESQPEILFWCDCGAKYDWRTKPLKKLN